MKRVITIKKPRKGSFNGLLIVGEAPGEKEEKIGKPFVGNSGKILDEWLFKAGIDRTECYITNVFHYRPNNNKISDFFANTRILHEQELEYDDRLPAFMGERVYTPYDKEIYRLRKEIKQAKPAVIVTLGKVALWGVTGRDSFSGALYEFIGRNDFAEPIAVVLPLYHPQYYSHKGRQPTMLLDIVKSLKRARKRAEKLMKER